MKSIKFFSIVFALCALCLITSCNKEYESTSVHGSKEIVIAVEDGSLDLTVDTRAVTAVDAIPASLNLTMTTGTSTQTVKTPVSSVSKPVSSNKINTGLYQTATATSYNYYLSNADIVFGATGCTIEATNDTDIIAGVTKASSSTTPSVMLNHIFARTGTITCASANGYTLSGLSYKLTSKTGGTGGTYNIYSDTWSNPTALPATTVTGSSDMYLVPGDYTLTVSGTEKLGDYSKTFTASADITLTAGKVNNISAKRTSSGATGIIISTTLTPWGSVTLEPAI